MEYFPAMNTDSFKTELISTDFCVVGGGMAGICAAVAAARGGAKTVLVQDRPVLGGNASSEVRMWICGAGSHGVENRETGIIEEIQLENLRWNPALQYNVWDHILQHFVTREPNIKLLLNCSCNGVETEDDRITKVKAWQLTTQKNFEIEAKFFADCSGDSVLRVSGAEFRWGREARSEFNESHAPEKADKKTMGNSILIQTRSVGKDNISTFVTPPWAYKFEEKGFHRGLYPRDNFWWIEYGGELDTIADSEEIRDELLKIAYGVWDLIKNSPTGIGNGFELEWISALPGKRENVRYVGDHILNQNDVEAEGKFEDMVAYGGWSMDDHHPAAFYHKGAPTIFHPAPSPYGIPFRSLYSKNISNLYFAGRNISATHMAMSSTRVMATCAVMGQAVGTAAAIGVRDNLTPREIYKSKIEELQEKLMDDDCWLPWHAREISPLTKNAFLKVSSNNHTENADVIRSGIDRKIGKAENCLTVPFGTTIEYRFDKPEHVGVARLVFDSDFNDYKRMPCFYTSTGYDAEIPETLIKEFSIEVQKGSSDKWEEVFYCEDNFKRHVKIDIDQDNVKAIKFVPVSSWGAEMARVFAFDVR